MRTRLVTVLALIVVCVSTVSAQLVQRVIDGDTIAIQGIGTVRLIGVDTPETVDPRKPVERFGQEASAFLRNDSKQGCSPRIRPAAHRQVRSHARLRLLT